jgi:hypothetical protein
MDRQPDWAHLPADILRHIAYGVCESSGRCLAEAKTLLRLVCQAWRAALPLGGQRVFWLGAQSWHPSARSLLMDTAPLGAALS